MARGWGTSQATLPLWLRWAVLAAVCVFMLLAAVASALWGTDRPDVSNVHLDMPVSFKWPPAQLAKFRMATMNSHPERTFLTTVSVTQDPDRVRLLVTQRLTLSHHDPLLKQFREQIYNYELAKALSYVVGTVKASEFPISDQSKNWDVNIRQASSRSTATVTATSVQTCPLARCHLDSVEITLSGPVWDRGKAYVPASTMRHAQVLLGNWPISNIAGATVISQRATGAVLLLTGNNAVISGILPVVKRDEFYARWYSSPGEPGDPRHPLTAGLLTSTVLVLTVSILSIVICIATALRNPPWRLSPTFCAMTAFAISAFFGAFTWLSQLAAIPISERQFLALVSVVAWTVLAPVAAASYVLRFGPLTPAWRKNGYHALWVICLLFVVLFAVLLARAGGLVVVTAWLPPLLTLTVIGLLLLMFNYRRSDLIWSVAVVSGTLWAASFEARMLPLWFRFLNSFVMTVLVAASTGLLWLPTLILAGALVQRTGAGRLLWVSGSACLCAVLYEPVALPFAGDTPSSWDLRSSNLSFYSAWPQLGYVLMGADAVACIAALGAVLLFRHQGQSWKNLPRRALVPLGIAVLVLAVEPIVVSFPASLGYFAAVATTIVVGFGTLLVPGYRGPHLNQLMVNRHGHTRRVRRLAKQHLMARAKRRLVRVSTLTLTDAQDPAQDSYSRWQALSGAIAATPDADPQMVERYALGGNAGFSPWQLGRATAGAAFLLCLPMTAYDLWAVRGWIPSLATVQILDVLRHSLRWVGYGFVYGYFYPVLAGRTPVEKAVRMLAALTPAEVLLVLFPQARGTSYAEMAVLLRLGEAAAFCMLLGLWWERKITIVAWMPWEAVRNLRSAKSLAAPATAVVITAATTIATALAGAATVVLLHSPTSSP